MLDTRNERRGNICRTASTYKRDETPDPVLAENSSKLSRLRRPGRAALVSAIFMAIFNGLIVLVFLILVAASMAVVGSMIVLALFDRLLSRKRSSGVTPEASNSESANSSNLERAFRNWRRERDVTDEH